jgi:4-hydroxybutyrate CoA-transferase
MGWKDDYLNKLCAASEAVKYVKSNDWVVLGHACGEPTVLTEALVENKDDYENVTLMQMIALTNSKYAQPGMEKHFNLNTYFCGAKTRESINSGIGDFYPANLHQIPMQFKDGSRPVDVALIQVSTPDEHGYCSFGISVDYTKAGTESAKLVMAEVNKQYPRTFGDSCIHVSDIDYIVESDREVIAFPFATIDETDMKIGEYTASLIEDGSTLQIGVGSVPDAVVKCLEKKKDLGIHSEILTDSMISLVSKGVINGSKKSIHKGKMVATLISGTKFLYDFVDNNPLIEMYGADYVTHPMTIARNHKMVSVNSCIQCDLMGQTTGDMIGEKQYSGVGGQNDFVRGASMCPDGKSILVFRSATKDLKYSKIVPFIDSGSSIINTRNDVDYVVTEYGIAHLKNKSIKDRAKALISIAHPSFRESLKDEYARRFKQEF